MTCWTSRHGHPSPASHARPHSRTARSSAWDHLPSPAGSLPEKALPFPLNRKPVLQSLGPYPDSFVNPFMPGAIPGTSAFYLGTYAHGCIET